MQLAPIHRKKKEKTDKELLAAYCATRNTEILGELFSRYMHLVFGVCLKYLKDREKSKDAVSQIYEKIQLELSKHEVQNFKSWLYVVTKNHCLMELRKIKPGKTILISNDEELDVFMENEPELHPVDRGPDELREQALQKCIEKLKDEQKTCIHLFYFESKSYREIAKKMNLNEKKVKSFIQNGKRNLKICLETK